MKKLLTTMALAAGLVLLPFAPVVHAVTGTFTVNTTVPNVSATVLVFPALSGGASSTATTTITIPALAGGVNGTAETRATATVDVTGATGSTTSLTVGGTEILGGTIDFTADASTTASLIAAQINSHATASSTGYMATSNGSTVTITAPVGSGATLNGTAVVSSGTLTLVDGSFSGGAAGTGGVAATTTTSSFAAVNAGAGADLTLNIGSTTITLIGGTTGAQAAAAVAAAINADVSNPYTATVVNTDKVQLTAKATGTAGNTAVVATDLDYNASGATFAASTSGHFAAVANASSTDLTLNIGSTTISLTGGMTAAAAASTTAAQINANASSTYTAQVVNGDEVKLSAKTSGTAGNGAVVASDLSYNTTAQVTTFTPAGVTVGETFRAVINGSGYESQANASSTAGTISTDLAAQMDANAAVSCTANAGVITCTASTPGTAFNATAQVLALGSPVLSPVTISSNATSTACASIGNTVTLNFTADQALNASSTTVTINGNPVTFTSLGGNAYSANATLNGSSTPGTVTFRIVATDMFGHTATTSSTTNSSSVTFTNGTPTITLNGDSRMNVGFGSTFNDPGVTTVPSNSSTTVTGTIDTQHTGDQTLVYTVTDCAGNTASTTRIVNVGAAPIGGQSHGGGGGGSNVPPQNFGQTVSAIAQLLAPITTGPAVPFFTQQVLGATTFKFTFHLKRGMTHEAVAELQRKLTELGLYQGPITGYFGNLTFKAVVKFQKGLGLPATGFVGPMTINVLNNS